MIVLFVHSFSDKACLYVCVRARVCVDVIIESFSESRCMKCVNVFLETRN